MALKNYYQSEEQTKLFTAAKRVKLAFEGSLPSADNFDTYMSEKADNADVFAGIKVAKDETIGEKLEQDTDEAIAVKQALQDAFKPTKQLSSAHKHYQISLDTLKKQLGPNAKPNEKPSHRAVVTYLHELKGATHRAISAQHEHEKQELEKLFKDNTFVENLKTSSGTTNIDKLKKEMFAKLAETQKKALDKFEESLTDSLNKLHKNSQEDMQTWLAVMHKNYPEMRRVINQVAQEKGNNAKAMQVAINADEGYALFKGITMEDLPMIQTLTKRPIQYDKDSKQFTMQLSSPLNFFYYYGLRNQVKSDIVSIAMAAKASGFSSITMTVNYHDIDYARELGREAYEACLKLGYDPKKVTIEVNGKPVPVNELFASQPDTLKRIEKEAETLNASSNRSLKAEVTKIRDTVRSAEQAAVDSPNNHAPQHT